MATNTSSLSITALANGLQHPERLVGMHFFNPVALMKLSEADADAAMKLGVNYPAGPFEWLAHWEVNAVIELLNRLDDYYRGERYRVSPWLRHQAWEKRCE